MRQYLLEGATGAFPFIVDRSKPLVTESRPSGVRFTRIPGRFSVCDCINGNGRRYGRRVWEKNLQPGSPLMKAIEANAAFGLLEHPKDGIVTLNSPISHLVTAAKLEDLADSTGKKITEVHGEISLVDTAEGNKLKALIEAGYNPLVSSRGYGSLVKGPDGVDDVQEDYVCESWDVVIKPSFENAALAVPREETESKKAAPATEVKVVTEAAPAAPAPAAKDLKESMPSTGAAAAAASAPQNNKAKPMEITEIKSRVQALRAVEPTKLEPQRFAETVALVEELHQEVAKWAAADATRSWEATKLHKELDTTSQALESAASAPARTAKKLTENNTKLMKVINAVAKTALAYRKQLGEAITGKDKSQKVAEELTKRGQGWREVAESRKEKLALVSKQFDTSCEALDIMAARYHEDTTELARRVLVLEFKEKCEQPDIAKQLKEANRLRHIIAIREKLEGKPQKPAVNEEGEKGECVAKKPGDVGYEEGDGQKKTKLPGAGEGEAPGKEAVKESKTEPKSEKKEEQAKAAPVAEAKVVYTVPGDPRGVNESVELVRRLSGATATK